MNNISCHICADSAISLVPGYEEFQRVTSDCKPWPRGGQLGVCRACGSIQKVIDHRWLSEIEKIYNDYSIYYQSNGVEQVVFEQETGQASPRSKRLIQRLQTQIELPTSGRLLDVGCGNGGFLHAFSSLIAGWSLAGTELNEKYRADVESISGVEALYTTTPDQVPGAFNLITMMHVLEHIPSPRDFLIKLEDKLLAGGLILIQVPDHQQNPFDLLIADHSTHFTIETLTNLVQSVGYQVVAVANDWVPKELTVVVCKGKVQSEPELDTDLSAHNLASVTKSLHWLKSLILIGKELSNQGQFGLFGTSIAGTWLFSELPDEVTFFVDEDPHRVGKTHLNHPIYSPGEVPHGSHVLIALPAKLANDIKLRLERSTLGFESYSPPPFSFK